MRLNDVFFVSGTGVVFGTILGGLGFSLLFILGACALLILLFFWLFGKDNREIFCAKGVVLFCIVVFAGGLYYSIDDYSYRSVRDNIEFSGEFSGRVTDVPRIKGDRRTLEVELDSIHANAKVLVYTYSPIRFSYGDEILINGEINLPPRDSYGKYLAKEGVHGVVFYPREIEVAGSAARPFFEALYGFREQIKNKIFNLFTQKRAAFLSGVLLGDRDEFSEDFLEKLSSSGTMHLTALSGLHMTIIIFIAFSIFSVLFLGKRRPVFIATFVLVFLFVAMTGFKISALRASIMAFIVALARQSDRMYNPRNAIIFAALFITLLNPKAPVFDLAFQLSFAATCSIIYFAPVIRRLSFFKEESFLNWRDILSITIAAQLGVAPITIVHFENLSLSALPANIAILVVIPLLMTLGFAAVFISFISNNLALLVSKPVSFFLDYAVAVVELFYKFRIPFNPDFNISAVVLYYCCLAYLPWRYGRPGIK